MTSEATDPHPPIDPVDLRVRIQQKYREVASSPAAGYHFHTGRHAARHVGYPDDLVATVPDGVVDAFAGVAYPFHWGLPAPGETVVDIGAGGGFDAVVAAQAVGPAGAVIGVDMTHDMIERARRAARPLGLPHLEFREGLAEDLPVPDGSVDLVISNGVMNLVPDKLGAYREVLRVLKPGGRFQIGDILVQRPVPEGARRDIDLWTG